MGWNFPARSFRSFLEGSRIHAYPWCPCYSGGLLPSILRFSQRFVRCFRYLGYNMNPRNLNHGGPIERTYLQPGYLIARASNWTGSVGIRSHSIFDGMNCSRLTLWKAWISFVFFWKLSIPRLAGKFTSKICSLLIICSKRQGDFNFFRPTGLWCWDEPQTFFWQYYRPGDSKWHFYPLVEGHQQPLKGSRFHHPKKVTSRIAREVFFCSCKF